MVVALAGLLAVVGQPVAAQVGVEEEPLLPAAIAESDCELRGRYVRQWKEADGALVLMFNGGFRLDMAGRRLTANDAVLWITSGRSEHDGRKYYSLTAYLSQDATVRERGGTITQDHVLLVSNLRTYGRLVKYHDAHAPEPMVDSPLYQQALRDRARIEAGKPLTAPEPEIARPSEYEQPRVERPARVIRYELRDIEPAQTPDGQPVFVSRGGVYFSQSGGPTTAVLEIRADNAVVFPVEGAAAALLGDDAAGERDEPPAPEPQPGQEPTEAEGTADGEQAPPPEPAARGSLLNAQSVAQGGIRAVYLEGDVVLSLGERFVRANRLYYDFERDRALILDAVFRADVPDRNIPLYVRADEIRQLSAREFVAEDARVSTSEFYTPHYHVGAERVYLRDRTERGAAGQALSRVAGTYELRNATFNIEGLPLSYWPYSKGDFETSETLIRRLRTGYSSDRGVTVESAWYLFNLLGLQAPPGYDATLELDYYSKRGPALGINADYAREDHFGLFRSRYLHDDGEDDLGPVRRGANEPSTNERGRVLWRHRHYLPNDWEATLEVAYISDPNYLESWERSEFHEGKEQETALYLKRARGVEAITLLANWRLLDFVTQTEHLPEIAYRRLGDTLGPFVSYHESRIGGVRYRPDDRRAFDYHRFDNTAGTDVVFRGDVRQELELPLRLADLNIVPFATLRGTYWDDAPYRRQGLWRGMGVYGLRGGTAFGRVFEDIESELLDIHRIRHIVRPEFAVWWAHSNVRSPLITPFDEGIETIDDFYGARAALHQTWQTKRGPAGDRRTVDLLRLDLEAGFFGGRTQPWEVSNGYANPIRPEDSRTRNYVAGDLVYRLSDTTSLLYDFNFDLNDGAFDRHDVSLTIERLPRLAYVVGARYAGDIDTNLVGGGFNYKLNEKHIMASRTWYDIERGGLGEVALSYVRKLPRWYLAVTCEWDAIFDDLTVSISVWPEGIPEWTIGSRRFTGLGTTTGIRP
ncbi:MAG: LPS assembly protein LptD [Planctomycetes bacterium]|nr:LPS assembly protein LptD [Planctomycetota bacterium]